jgi:hypothetical protein
MFSCTTFALDHNFANSNPKRDNAMFLVGNITAEASRKHHSSLFIQLQLCLHKTTAAISVSTIGKKVRHNTTTLSDFTPPPNY